MKQSVEYDTILMGKSKGWVYLAKILALVSMCVTTVQRFYEANVCISNILCKNFKFCSDRK